MTMELPTLITICILLCVGPAMSYNYGGAFFLHRGPDGDVVDTDFGNLWTKFEANQTNCFISGLICLCRRIVMFQKLDQQKMTQCKQGLGGNHTYILRK